MDENTIFIILTLVFFVGIFGLFVFLALKETKFDIPRYMKQQQETGQDKMRMLHFMQQIMQDKYGNFQYVAAHHISTEQRPGKTIYRYHPYIIAFSASGLMIVSYIVKDKEIFYRNAFPVDFSQTKVTYKFTKEGISLTFLTGQEKLPMDVHRIVKSSGYEKCAKPLGIYQEAEVEQLISFLPGYSN